jgi:hypothetical protein
VVVAQWKGHQLCETGTDARLYGRRLRSHENAHVGTIRPVQKDVANHYYHVRPTLTALKQRRCEVVVLIRN